jgi:ubiquitin-fold modifier 1
LHPIQIFLIKCKYLSYIIYRIEVSDEAPFTHVIRFISSHFGVSPDTSAIITNSGVGVHPNQTAGTIFMKYGGDLKLIPRDQVGSN